MQRLSVVRRAVATAIALPWAVAFAQDTVRSPHAAQPERPTVATHAGTVAPGWLEVEAGLEIDRGTNPAHQALGLMVAKIGIAPRLQLSLFGSTVSRSDAPAGIGDLAAGIKWRLLDDNPLLGDFAVLPSLKWPTGSVPNGNGTGTSDASLLLISSRDAGPLHMDFNAAWIFRGGSGVNAPRDAWVWSASFSGPIRGRLAWTAELFGYPGTGGPQGDAPSVAFLAGAHVRLARMARARRRRDPPALGTAAACVLHGPRVQRGTALGTRAARACAVTI